MSSFMLKCIAMLTMLIDHVGFVLFPEQMIWRIIGRVAFPLFAFLIVQGVLHTSYWKRYGIRLLLFAFLSEIPFDLATSGQWVNFYSQNIFFTLLFGMLVVEASIYFEAQGKVVYGFGLAFVIGFLCDILRTDYGMLGILIIYSFYMCRYSKMATATMTIVLNFVEGTPQLFAGLAVIPIYFYNGTLGLKNKWIQYGFYAFYPVHLLILAAIAGRIPMI